MLGHAMAVERVSRTAASSRFCSMKPWGRFPNFRRARSHRRTEHRISQTGSSDVEISVSGWQEDEKAVTVFVLEKSTTHKEICWQEVAAAS